MTKYEKNMTDRHWRLNNLYTIVTDQSEAVRFRFRPVQELFYRAMWYWNLILKSRQHGLTTFIDLFMLDACLFHPNIHAGIVAHNLKDAQKIFHNKVKFPYEHLPDELKSAIPTTKDDGMEMRWANGSQLWVGTSMRSQTLRMLHVSEHGKLCALFPKKALELKTGALPTLHDGSYLFVESTAEGAGGDFYDWAMASQSVTALAEKEGRKLNKQQMKFHFFGWHDNPEDQTDPLGIPVSDELERYFESLSKDGIEITERQKAFYALKKDGPGGYGSLMKREYPSTPTEAFEQATEGAIYAEQLERARAEGRIGFYPWEQAAQTYTFWDLGYSDATAVIFVQFLQREIRIMDYYEMTGRGAQYHAKQVLDKPYIYADHYGPHDVMQHEKGTGLVLADMYANFGLQLKKVHRPKLKSDGIAAGRGIFNQVTINEKTCTQFLHRMAFYRFEWDEVLSQYKKDPVHDAASHTADAFQTLALQYRWGTIKGERIGYPHPIPVEAQGDGVEQWNVFNHALGKTKRRKARVG